jgi:hypothetical protein
MTSNKGLGDRIADWALANGQRLGVTYVIWNGRIFDRRNGKGWQPYSGPSPHTDHVHISFAGSGDPSAPVSNVGINDLSQNAGCLGWLLGNSNKSKTDNGSITL